MFAKIARKGKRRSARARPSKAAQTSDLQASTRAGSRTASSCQRSARISDAINGCHDRPFVGAGRLSLRGRTSSDDGRATCRLDFGLICHIECVVTGFPYCLAAGIHAKDGNLKLQ